MGLWSQEEQVEVYIDDSTATSRDQDRVGRLFFEAQRFKAIGEERKALEKFKKCLELEPNNAAINYEVARYYLSQQSPESARPYLEAALAAEPDNVWMIRSEWELAKLRYQSEAELEALDRLIELQPADPEFVWERAMVYLQMNQVDSAVADLRRLEVLMGPNEVITDQLVRIFLESGRDAEAEQVLKEAVAVSGSRIAPRIKLAELYRSMNRADDALAVYRGVLDIAPNNPRAHLFVAEYLFRSNQFDSSKVHVRVALGSPQMEMEDKLGVMSVFMNLAGQDPSVAEFAAEMADTLVVVHPMDPDAYSIKAAFALRAGHLSESRRLWLTAVSLPEGDNWEVWQQILQTDIQMGVWDTLHADAQRVLERYPNQPAGYLFDGLALSQLGKYNDAIEIMEEGELYSINNPEVQDQFWLQLSSAYQSAGELEDALEYLQQILDRTPNHPTALNNYAYFLAEADERLDEAERMIQQAVLVSPVQYTFWDTYAWVLYRKNDLEGALVKINKAMQLGGTSDAAVIEHKADILAALGRNEDARQMYQSALRAGGDAERIQKKLDEL